MSILSLALVVPSIPLASIECHPKGSEEAMVGQRSREVREKAETPRNA